MELMAEVSVSWDREDCGLLVQGGPSEVAGPNECDRDGLFHGFDRVELGDGKPYRCLCASSRAIVPSNDDTWTFVVAIAPAKGSQPGCTHGSGPQTGTSA